VDRLTLADLAAAWSDVEAMVDRTPEADRWCSGPDWILPAHDAFAPGSEPLLVREGEALACLARYEGPDGMVVIGGLEPLWGFACPLLGPDPATTAALVRRLLAADRDWDVAALGGLPPDRALLRAVGAQLIPLGRVGLAEGIVRQVAHLDADGDGEGGLEGFWSRRSARFRRNLRRAHRAAADAGLVVVDASDEPGLLARLQRIEAGSWKGMAGDGLASPTMAAFYRHQLERLRARQRVRALVATRDGADVGFIVGGRRGNAYRGLQLSYTESVRDLSVGHLLQAHEVQRLAAEGVRTYDLGMDLPYKRSWADRAVPSVTLVVHRASVAGRSLR
jgi:CelD/BcsL family acetyltransferase involved in cellulose biosynthesis